MHQGDDGTAAPPPGPPPKRNDLFLNGVAVVATEGCPAGVPMVLRALDSFRDDEISREAGLGRLPFACRVAHNVWDFDRWSVLSARLVDLARQTEALPVLPSARHRLVCNRALAGAEAVTIGEVTGSRFFAQYAALALEPWRGAVSTRRELGGAFIRSLKRCRWRMDGANRYRLDKRQGTEL